MRFWHQAICQLSTGHSGWHPRVPCDALIEVFGHVYGLNDAPSAWYKTLDGALLEVGFERSRLDRCLYFMREGRQLTGTVGIHVDDSVTGGQVQNYERALSLLKEKFEFRTWRVRDGDFCGARYTQSEATGEITMTQESFVQKVRPLHLSPPSAEDILQIFTHSQNPRSPHPKTLETKGFRVEGYIAAWIFTNIAGFLIIIRP